jgi:hypothetical protein
MNSEHSGGNATSTPTQNGHANSARGGGGRRGGRGGRGRGRGRRGGRGGGRASDASGGHKPDEHAVSADHSAVTASAVENTKDGHDTTSRNRGNRGGRGSSPRRGGRRGGRGKGRGRGRGRGENDGDAGTNEEETSNAAEGGDHEPEEEHFEDENTELNGEGETPREEVCITNERATADAPENPGEGMTEVVALPAQEDEPPKPVLALPTPPRSDKVMILSRHQQLSSADDAQQLAEGVAAVALNDENDEATDEKKENPKKKRKPRKKKDKKNGENYEEEEEGPPVEAPPEPVSTTEAIDKLPAQEVSITASTAVKIRRNESSASFKSDNTPPKVAPMSLLSKSGKIVSNKGKNKKKKKLSGDDQANQAAAQRFNSSVQKCVAQSDPDGLRDLLHDRHNHNFALDAMVLESVMKAYVMAAMFEDALYCLRHCTLPGTLATVQTERILQCLPQNLRNSSAYTAADMITALCIATEFDTPTTRTYFMRIVRGIALEFLEEATSARDRVCSSSCERLVRSGICVVDSRLQRGKKATDIVVLPGHQLGVFVPDTMENRGIQAGDAVSILPYAGPYPLSAESLDRDMIEGTVTNTNPMVLRLQAKGNASLHATLTENIRGNVYRIDKLANRMGFNRQLSAAVSVCSPLNPNGEFDPRRPSPQLVRAVTAMDENIDRFMGNDITGSAGQVQYRPDGTPEFTSTAGLCSEAISWTYKDDKKIEYDTEEDQDSLRTTARLMLDKYNALEGFNHSQQLAVEGAVTNRLTLVQGPPGTGKTAVAIRILSHWAKLAKGDSPILATSDSNIAVDNLVEGCASVGLQVVRLGRPEAIRPELLRYCIDRPPSSYGNNDRSQSRDGPSSHKERVKQLKSAQVICCTCIGSGGDILDAMKFERVLVDEATQATEPAILVPLMRGCRQLVLVGDHCQLPPTVLSTRAEEEGHGVPLFSRMVACGVPPYMLDTQYRMHPRIAMFPSDLFYGGLLKNGVSPPERRPLQGFPWPVEEFPVAFIPVEGIEMDDGVSKYNEAEAETACKTVAMLLAGGQCRVSDIAVVTPYAAQAKLIRRMTRRLQETTGPPYIEVSSVDGFQGREKEAIVFSAVRCNEYGAIGFTSDWRRVNVSFTRARRALIVIGNDNTLRRGDPETWSPWLAWVDAHGLNMDRPGAVRGRYDAEQLRRVRGGTTAAEMLKDVLARQQAQLKNAERQQEQAERKTEGHVRAKSEADAVEEKNARSLEDDLAEMENADGDWDDTDDEEEVELKHSVSRTTLTSATSSTDLKPSDAGQVDVWDL